MPDPGGRVAGRQQHSANTAPRVSASVCPSGRPGCRPASQNSIPASPPSAPYHHSDDLVGGRDITSSSETHSRRHNGSDPGATSIRRRRRRKPTEKWPDDRSGLRSDPIDPLNQSGTARWRRLVTTDGVPEHPNRHHQVSRVAELETWIGKHQRGEPGPRGSPRRSRRAMSVRYRAR